jgi:hypothetical protein
MLHQPVFGQGLRYTSADWRRGACNVKFDRKVVLEVLEVIIAGQNCLLLWDIFFRHETVQWGKLAFSFASLLVLLLIVVINYKAARVKEHSAAVAAIPLNQPTIEIRKAALDEIRLLLMRGDYLIGHIPSAGATASDFGRFWSELMQQWSQEAGTLLSNTWGAEAMNDLFSIRGVQFDLPNPRVHPEVLANYHQLNRWLENLERLRQTLPRS